MGRTTAHSGQKVTSQTNTGRSARRSVSPDGRQTFPQERLVIPSPRRPHRTGHRLPAQRATRSPSPAQRAGKGPPSRRSSAQRANNSSSPETSLEQSTSPHTSPVESESPRRLHFSLLNLLDLWPCEAPNLEYGAPAVFPCGQTSPPPTNPISRTAHRQTGTVMSLSRTPFAHCTAPTPSASCGSVKQVDG